ncbi:hypothetical protein MMUC44124_01075 [Mycolicibacterium mucogenicum DSM 44124]|nr:hypothetical protein MMUC44124_01075 [Mycolicibacterium mucogenicum DSM 44124]
MDALTAAVARTLRDNLGPGAKWVAPRIVDALTTDYQVRKKPRGLHDGWGHSPRCVKGCGRAQYSRGMCRPCWEIARDAGEFIAFGTFVEEYTAAVRTGLGQPAIAADMGITCASLMRKLERYKLPVTRELRIAAKEQRDRKVRS